MTFSTNDKQTGHLKRGVLTISLDFELHWGIFPTKSVEAYQTNLKGTKKAIEAILKAFDKFDIHATWATVGFLFFKNKKELQSALPKQVATYTDTKFDPYPLLESFEEKYAGDFYFASGQIEQIKNTPHQEIGTHTFSHYYCLEDGQKPEQFKADLEAAVKILESLNLKTNSIVFPRNQYNENYIDICKQLDIRYLRSNPEHFIYKSRKKAGEKKLIIRILRLLDTYINITGHQLGIPSMNNGIVNIPGSRTLRPFNSKLRIFQKLKLRRIKKEMTLAAQQHKLYHLWWHPHNFGTNTEANLQLLASILAHYQVLKKQYGFQSLNMQEVGALWDQQLQKD